ncbi:MAG: hypothetical protein U9O65_05610, partial [Thermotogota bacterium]|nr:hypothetical protein [Thermotogota bacterium]
MVEAEHEAGYRLYQKDNKWYSKPASEFDEDDPIHLGVLPTVDVVAENPNINDFNQPQYLRDKTQYEAFNKEASNFLFYLGTDLESMGDYDFEDKYGTTKHRMLYDFNPEYKRRIREESAEMAKKYGSITYPSTDIRSSNYQGNPNMSIFTPVGIGDKARWEQDWAESLVESALLPGLDFPVGAKATAKALKAVRYGRQAGKGIINTEKAAAKNIGSFGNEAAGKAEHAALAKWAQWVRRSGSKSKEKAKDLTDAFFNYKALRKKVSEANELVLDLDVEKAGSSMKKREALRKLSGKRGEILRHYYDLRTQYKNSLFSSEFDDITDMLAKAEAEVKRFEENVKHYNLSGNDIEESAQKGPLSFATRTTDQTEGAKIIDFVSGKEKNIYVHGPSEKTIYSKVKGRGIVKENQARGWDISEEYVPTVRKNIDYLEKNIPGLKVVGSSRGVAEGGLKHVIGDYEGIISRKDYEKYVSGRYKKIMERPVAVEHTVNPKYGEAGKIEFIVIDEAENGMAEGKMAEELYRQFFPDEHQAAVEEMINRGDGVLKISKTPKQLIEETDPTVKSIMDMYESDKRKHINKIDSYIHYGDPDKVLQAQEKFIKSLVGSKGTIGKQFTTKDFSDITKNLKILREIDFAGEIRAVIRDPKRMQVVINDWYINNTTLTRQVSGETLSDIKGALKRWNVKSSGQAHGAGQNWTLLGDPGWVGRIVGYRQVGLESSNIKDPLKYIDDVKRRTHGNYPFSKTERNEVSDI